MDQHRLAFHRAIMVVDVERFGDPSRTNLDQLAVRDGLYKALTQAFEKTQIVGANCVIEDRGDGALVLVPPEVPKSRLVTSIPAALVTAICGHNAGCSVQARIRLRMALHAGEIHQDAHGVVGAAINHTFRLAEVPVLKSALDRSSGVLAVIVSSWFFDEVVRHNPAADPGSYRPVQVAVKETETVAWIRLPDDDPAQLRDRSATEHMGRPGRMRAGTAAEVPPRRATREVAIGTRAVDLLGSISGGIHAAADGAHRRAVPSQLPHDTGGFTGREPELAALEALAAEIGAAVVISAVDGAAGIGKTALAVHFAHRVADRFPNGQLHVNLRGFDPSQPPLAPDAVLAGFLRALGIHPSQIPSDIDELAALYRSVLAGRRILVILDNAVSADQVRPLLPGTPGCLVIVTSRNRLGGLVARDGARRLTLDLLTPTEAVDLLASVAGAECVAADSAGAAELAQLCGWLPLALRVAADRAAAHPHLTLSDLIDELTGERFRLDVLTAGEETTQVRAVFSWSYRALPPEPARAFRLLGLHLGFDISTPAAAALIGTTVHRARQLLTTLTSGHLLEETGRDRYQLHDLLRLYAAECAQTSEPETGPIAVRRLLNWYLHTADAFTRSLNPGIRHVSLDPPEPVCRPPAFISHRHALDWAKAELTNLMPAVRQAAAIGEHVIAWKLAVTLVPLFGLHRRNADCLDALYIALAEAQELGDRTAEAWALGCLSETYLCSGHPEETTDFAERASAIAAEIGDAYALWAAPLHKGLAFLDLERFADAADYLEQALIAARQTSNLRALGVSLTCLGLAYQNLGRLMAAADLHQQALTVLSPTRASDLRQCVNRRPSGLRFP